VTRGDLITVALSGEDGKPRPALVIQSDFLPETDSVLVCLTDDGSAGGPALSAVAAGGGGDRAAGAAAGDGGQDHGGVAGAVRGGDRAVGEGELVALGRLLALVVGTAD